MQERRPEVTVTDPARTDDGAATEQAEPSAGRGRALAAGLLVLGAAVLVVAHVAAGPEPAPDDPAPDAVRGLSVSDRRPASESAGFDVATGEGRVDLRIDLVNAGPTPLRVRQAVFGKLRFDGDVRLAAEGGTSPLVLSRRTACPQDGSAPAVDDAAGGLTVLVQTRDGLHDVDLDTRALPLGQLRTAPQRACRFVPLEDPDLVSAAVQDTEGRRAELSFVVTNASRQPALLESLSFAPGVRLREVDGRAPAFPLLLAPAPADGTGSQLLLDVRVGLDCGVLRVTGPGQLSDARLVVRHEGAVRPGVVTTRLRRAERLRQLAERSCPSG